MKTLHNPTAERSLKNDARTYKSKLNEVSKHVNSIAEFIELVESPAQFSRSKVLAKNPKADELGLDFLSLVQLYKIPFAEYQAFQAFLERSPFTEFVVYDDGLKLDSKKLKQYIELNSTIPLSKAQQDAYKGLKKAADALNATNKKLKEYGTSVSLADGVTADYKNEWSVNERFLLSVIRSR